MNETKKNKYNKIVNSQLLGVEDPASIIYELLSGLNKKIENTLLYIEKGKIEEAKLNAAKAQNIAVALQNSLDKKNGGDIAVALEYLYEHIHFAAENFIKNDNQKHLKSAFHVISEIFDGWKGLINKIA